MAFRARDWAQHGVDDRDAAGRDGAVESGLADTHRALQVRPWPWPWPSETLDYSSSLTSPPTPPPFAL